VTGPIRLVLADDTEPLRILLRRVFDDDARFEVVGEASDGLEALERVDELQPDLLLLDLSMPRMDGLEVLDRLVTNRKSTQVIVLSGHAADAAAEASLQRGALAYIEKGVRPARLLATVAELMEQARSGVHTPITVRSDATDASPNGQGADRPAPTTTVRAAAEIPADAPDGRLEPPDDEPGLETLVSQLVHDLRSPVGLAVGYLDLLRRRELDPEPAVLVDRINMALGHLDELVTTLGAYARAARQPLDRTTVDVEGALHDALAKLTERRQLAPDHVRLHDTGTRVTGDAAALMEVLYQLLDNAVTYAPDTPVDVRVSADDEHVTIAVIDGGPGLDNDDRDNLFAPFKRGIAARGNWGTGLGLPLAVRLVRAMDGTIWAATDTDTGGAVFTVHLPAGRYDV
jgi:signal transduction histidine kinase